MFEFFRSVANRLKALFAVNAVLDLEAEVLSRSAERKAEMLRRAQHYENEGLGGIALHLRQQAERIDLDKPLASVLPALTHWRGDAEIELSDSSTVQLAAEQHRGGPVKSLNPSRRNASKA